MVKIHWSVNSKYSIDRVEKHSWPLWERLTCQEAILVYFCPSLQCDLIILLCPGPSIQSKTVTNQQMDDIAAKLGAKWKTLASHLEVKAAEMRAIETDSEDVDMQAKLLLVAWQDREGPQATVENLVAALNAAGFGQIADGLNEA